MAKRKNPLKDLDAFLKQEAKNFVQPKKVEPVKEQLTTDETKLKPTKTVKTTVASDNITQIDFQKAKEYLSGLKKSNNPEFYDVLLRSVEDAGTESSENKMLINTILYLRDKENWKENIKNYWS